MKCPHCNETLLMTERYNIEIDYCPSCRGIWLDKGELDKMLAYAEEKYKAGQQSFESDQPYPGHQPSWPKHEGDDNKHHPKYHKHKRKGFLGELFDFD